MAKIQRAFSLWVVCIISTVFKFILFWTSLFCVWFTASWCANQKNITSLGFWELYWSNKVKMNHSEHIKNLFENPHQMIMDYNLIYSSVMFLLKWLANRYSSRKLPFGIYGILDTRTSLESFKCLAPVFYKATLTTFCHQSWYFYDLNNKSNRDSVWDRIKTRINLCDGIDKNIREISGMRLWHRCEESGVD